jgi:SOS-response transcriptional repressor LexA
MPFSTKLSPRVDQVYDFIVKFKSDHGGNSPTIREIADAVEIPSTSTVDYYLGILEHLGKIKRSDNKGESRMIEVIGGVWMAPTGLTAIDLFNAHWIDVEA